MTNRQEVSDRKVAQLCISLWALTEIRPLHTQRQIVIAYSSLGSHSICDLHITNLTKFDRFDRKSFINCVNGGTVSGAHGDAKQCKEQ